MPERTIRAWCAAAMSLWISASARPVVPTTWTMRAWAASSAKKVVAEGAVKSRTPSVAAKTVSGSSVTLTPSGGRPARVPASWPRAGEPSRSTAPLRVQPSVSVTARMSIRPMRPSAPTTASRILSSFHENSRLRYSLNRAMPRRGWPGRGWPRRGCRCAGLSAQRLPAARIGPRTSVTPFTVIWVPMHRSRKAKSRPRTRAPTGPMAVTTLSAEP